MRLTRHKRTALAAILISVIIVSIAAGAIGIQAKIEDRSAGSVFFEYALRTALHSKDNRPPQKTEKLIQNAEKKNADFTVPDIYKSLYGFDVQDIRGIEACYFGGSGASTLVYYLHGGAFIYQPTPLHYRLCRLLARQLDAQIIMPIYPKAPQYTYMYTLETVYDVYNEAAEGGTYSNIVLMGDSAGGSLALSLGQYIVEQGGISPDNIIAFSPCVNMSLTNPDIPIWQKKDPMLDASDLQLKFDVYFDGNSGSESYLVSPMYCDYANMPPVTIFAGGYEILTPDIRKLTESLKEQNIYISYYEYPAMAHTFVLLPIPEARNALEKIRAIVK